MSGTTEDVAGVPPATPSPHLMVAMLTSSIGAFVGLLTPLTLLLTLHLTRLVGDGAASAFGIISGLGALFIAPLLLGIGGFTALYLTLTVIALLGAATVRRLPEIGREGDPRWAVITTGTPVPATVTP